jgi:OMF family outer membrane factor
VASARADLESAEAQAARVEQSIRLEVETAWVNLRQSAEGIAAADAARTEARASLQAAERRYGAGVAILLEVTDAQARASRAEVQLVQALYDYNVAFADLRRAQGESWHAPPPTR